MKTFLRIIVRTAIVVFILINIITAFHAYKFTHFYNRDEVTIKKQDEKSGWDKTKEVLFGINAVKKKDTVVPGPLFQTVYLKTKDGLKLEAWYIPVSSPVGTVCLFHGHGGNKSDVFKESEEFRKMGYNTLLLDFRAHGNSEGNTCTIGYYETEDIKLAYDYIAGKGEKNIVLWGISMGAAAVSKSICDYTLQPTKVILEMPFGSILDAAEGRIKMMKLPVEPLATLIAFWGSTEHGFWAFNMKPTEFVKKINCPVLVQWGAMDPRVTRTETEAIYNNIHTAKKLVVYETAGHESLCKKETEKWKAEVGAFFEMTDPKNISILDYTYDLPVEKIALHPLTERDASKLLVYQDGKIQEDSFKNIDAYLPSGSLLIFNNTKVIRARINFQKSSGGIIEIFCLEPYETINEYSSIMNKKATVKWKCMIGGAGKWKEGPLELKIKNVELKIVLKEKLPDAYVVEFSWMPAELSFAEILEHAGEIPLPPYIKRKAEAEDAERYQTIYAADEGSVAAPTAGLHFSKEIFDRLAEKNIQTGFVTLHVGAGTFKPVKAATMQDHIMHAEWIEVSAGMIENLRLQLSKTIIAVGTTSLRTLESLYWMGIKTLHEPSIQQLQLNQWEVYEDPLCNSNIPQDEALSALLNWMKKNDLDKLLTRSQILIAPEYSFKIVNAIITNFHQPQSTLLLLVAAATGDRLFAGQAGWRKIYDHALQNGFRFLSYGDGSLLFIHQ